MLEKILEEIEKKQVMLQPFDGVDRPTGIINVDVVKEIIRKHMNDKASNGDLISRQALLDDFRKTITEQSDTMDWLDMIARQKAVSMNDGWIPVEKCLPEDGRDVLVTKSTGKVEIITFNKFLYEHPEYSHGVKVTAWQPHPEPYRPEKGGDNSDNNL